MGGLEGLINILDSEGGFGALETQVRNAGSVLRKWACTDIIYAKKLMKEIFSFCLSKQLPT